jgi:hypothetical protein
MPKWETHLLSRPVATSSVSLREKSDLFANWYAFRVPRPLAIGNSDFGQEMHFPLRDSAVPVVGWALQNTVVATCRIPIMHRSIPMPSLAHSAAIRDAVGHQRLSGPLPVRVDSAPGHIHRTMLRRASSIVQTEYNVKQGVPAMLECLRRSAGGASLCSVTERSLPSEEKEVMAAKRAADGLEKPVDGGLYRVSDAHTSEIN